MSRRPIGDGEFSVEHIDVLRADRSHRDQVRADMLSIAHGAARRPEPRIQGYIDQSTDPQVFGLFQGLALFRHGDRPVAYCYGFAQVLDVDGREIDVMRNSTATLPEYRSRGFSSIGYLDILWHFARRHLRIRRPRYLAAMCFSQVVYAMLARRVRHVVPSTRARVDPELLRVHRAIHGQVDLIEEPAMAPFESAGKLSRLQASSDPFVRFFLDSNPRFTEGFALPVTARINSGDLLYALGVSAVGEVARHIRVRSRS